MDLKEDARAGATVVNARGRVDAASSVIFADWRGQPVASAQPRRVVGFAEEDLVSSAGLPAVFGIAVDLYPELSSTLTAMA
jgi:hypothetical protein